MGIGDVYHAEVGVFFVKYREKISLKIGVLKFGIVKVTCSSYCIFREN